MLRIALFLVLILICVDCRNRHRDRGSHKREEESLLDKLDRDDKEKDRKKDNDTITDEKLNLTCYQCDGDQCRDPFRPGDLLLTKQCEYSCWKGVFAASVRRSCGNKRCAFGFKGGSAISNTCCKTSFCNGGQIRLPQASSLIVLIALSSLFIRLATV